MPEFFDRFRRYPALRTVIVNLTSGTSFRGVLWRRRGPFVVLRSAHMLLDRGNQVGDGKGQALDGEVLVKLSDIDFMQAVN